MGLQLDNFGMHVSITGTGNVGTALADGFTATGHSVVLGSRHPDTGGRSGVEITTQREAAERGDVVVLALPAGVVADVAADLSDALADKPVIDTANAYPTAESQRSVAARVADAARVVLVIRPDEVSGQSPPSRNQ